MPHPIKTFRYRGISASVFENETYQQGTPHRFFKVSLQRTFVQDKQYKHNSSFGRDDIPIAMMVLNQAWQFILESEAAHTVHEPLPSSHTDVNSSG